ncbi:sulfur carrier protein ThiS [Taylorella asinigenitalis]|uniref:sulfur carrier protein ThiS n=1 Tax=Taylorella asinigenitalis TaxID=84590 RepID=UPI0003F9AB48|nr:sulfur carrier protein ThiS [Taylorella asinigenitalis]
MTIKIFLNNEIRNIDEGTSLEAFLEQEIFSKSEEEISLASAVNSNFIPKSQRSTYILQELDQVSTFTPITGG